MIWTMFFVYIKDDLPNSVPFVQFKKPENLFFHVFENVQMGQNRAKNHISCLRVIKSLYVLTNLKCGEEGLYEEVGI